MGDHGLRTPPGELLKAFGSHYFMQSRGMYVMHGPIISLSWILSKALTNQPRWYLATKTSLIAENTVEKLHSINHPLFTDAAEDPINRSTLYSTISL